MNWKLLGIILVVTLSGCTGFGTSGPDSSDDRSEVQTEEIYTTAEPQPDNPFGKENVTVSIRNSPSHLNATQQVQSALSYWDTGPGKDHTNYSANFVLKPHANDTDVVVSFENISVCYNEHNTSFLGCAAILDNDSIAEKPEVVRISPKYSSNSTQKTIIHEFGHIYGLTHSSELDIMNASGNAARRPMPNATERDNPWEISNSTTVRSELTVGINKSTVSRNAKYRLRDQTDTAIEYFNTDADSKRPENLSLRYAESVNDPHIEIRTSEDVDDDLGWDWELYGIDPDNDTALENYNKLIIILNDDVETDYYSYYIAQAIQLTFVREYDNLVPELDGKGDSRDAWYD